MKCKRKIRFYTGKYIKEDDSIHDAKISERLYSRQRMVQWIFWFVGRFGTTAGLSAVSTGSQILNLVTFVITQLAMGITVLIARYIGEKHTSQIGELLGGATTVFTMIAVILLVVMVFFAKPLAVLMQAPQEALMLTSVYVRICGGGIFFIVAYNVLSAIFRGLGDSRSPLIFCHGCLRGKCRR